MNLIAHYASPLGTLELQSTGEAPALPGGGYADGVVQAGCLRTRLVYCGSKILRIQ
ncbi:MAG: hypothetical protein IJ586_01275 [Alloprevotella sp.]|nr:hypothetical protein [Alloprevotella sp.]